MEGVHVSHHPLVKHKLTILRDKSTNSTQFRQLVREISILLCCEATQDLALSHKLVETPMGRAEGWELDERIGLVGPVLDAADLNIQNMHVHEASPIEPRSVAQHEQ